MALFTLVSVLPIAPQGPFDARDYSRPRGMTLEVPALGALIEPLAAPGHILAGAPDFRIAGVVTLLWVVLGAAGGCVLRDLRALRRRPVGSIALRAAASAGAGGGILLLLVAFAVVLRLPDWRLVVEDPAAIVADLHSHTLRSHDGLIPARVNLRWHAARGYGLVAITEHGSPDGSFAAEALAQTAPEEMPAVLPGLEVASERGGYLVALGLAANRPVPRPAEGRNDPGFAARFVRSIHEEHGGAVIALHWRLTPDEVDALADTGVDGFEIANFGHPEIKPEVRDAVLRVSRTRGLALVASSDWHGWGGFARTWTVLRGPATPLSPQQKAAFTVAQLRAHRAETFVPVVAGYLGQPSLLRALFAPLAETVRYAAELSPARVLAWWLWVAALFGAARSLSRRGLRPGRALLGALLLVLGAGLTLPGLSLVRAWAGGLASTTFPADVGAKVVALGVLSLSASAVLLLSARKRPLVAGLPPE